MSMGITHVQRVAFVGSCFFMANLATFLLRFLFFNRVLFADRSSRLRPALSQVPEQILRLESAGGVVERDLTG
jgi:hypothetical protein